MTEQDILIDYFAMLERRGFEVTVNDFSGLIVADSVQSARFAPYFIHRNTFCMKIKSDAHLWNECLKKKTVLCAAAAHGTMFRGMCFCGREEYIMPVIKDGIVLATIGLGGFSSDRNEALARAKRAMAVSPDMEYIAAVLDSASAIPVPESEDAAAILGLAAAELLRCYETLEAAKGSLVIPEAARLSRERRLALHAADYLRRNRAESVSAQDLARACHVSVSTLSHVFKKSMGMSLAAWLTKLRIEAAKALLSQGATVTGAALESGFDDPNYFSRVFAKAEGLPPGVWAQSRIKTALSSVSSVSSVARSPVADPGVAIHRGITNRADHSTEKPR